MSEREPNAYYFIRHSVIFLMLFLKYQRVVLMFDVEIINSAHLPPLIQISYKTKLYMLILCFVYGSLYCTSYFLNECISYMEQTSSMNYNHSTVMLFSFRWEPNFHYCFWLLLTLTASEIQMQWVHSNNQKKSAAQFSVCRLCIHNLHTLLRYTHCATSIQFMMVRCEIHIQLLYMIKSL